MLRQRQPGLTTRFCPLSCEAERVQAPGLEIQCGSTGRRRAGLSAVLPTHPAWALTCLSTDGLK